MCESFVRLLFGKCECEWYWDGKCEDERNQKFVRSNEKKTWDCENQKRKYLFIYLYFSAKLTFYYLKEKT